MERKARENTVLNTSATNPKRSDANEKGANADYYNSPPPLPSLCWKLGGRVAL